MKMWQSPEMKVAMAGVHVETLFIPPKFEALRAARGLIDYNKRGQTMIVE